MPWLWRGKRRGTRLGPPGYLCCFGLCEDGQGSGALPLPSAHTAGQSHPPLPFDLEKERLIWESGQGDARLPKLLVSVDLGWMRGLLF